MAFFILKNAKLSLYEFSYLTGAPEMLRLEKTRPAHSAPSAKSSHQEQTKVIYAVELMQKRLHTLPPQASLSEASKLFDHYGFHHIPIAIDGRLKGILSDRDYLKHSLKKNRGEILVSDVMSTLVLVATEHTPLAHVSMVLVKENISALPVISDQKTLMGLITTRDILKWVMREF